MAVKGRPASGPPWERTSWGKMEDSVKNVSTTDEASCCRPCSGVGNTPWRRSARSRGWAVASGLHSGAPYPTARRASWHAAAALKWRRPQKSERHLIMMFATTRCGRWIILRLSAQLAQRVGTLDLIAERNPQPPEANGRLARPWRPVAKGNRRSAVREDQVASSWAAAN